MSRSKQRSHCPHSCWMCDPGKREPGTAKPGDERKLEHTGDELRAWLDTVCVTCGSFTCGEVCSK